ncbi:MAG TPA: hypothetical protein VNX25_08635, partial [Verrucomicrobiae bacterium]|nr:hypothetical protein [Verrucomicrobiae bacterium]
MKKRRKKQALHMEKAPDIRHNLLFFLRKVKRENLGFRSVAPLPPPAMPLGSFEIGCNKGRACRGRGQAGTVVRRIPRTPLAAGPIDYIREDGYDSRMHRAAGIFKALADETRLRILALLLAEGE